MSGNWMNTEIVNCSGIIDPSFIYQFTTPNKRYKEYFDNCIGCGASLDQSKCIYCSRTNPPKWINQTSI